MDFSGSVASGCKIIRVRLSFADYKTELSLFESVELGLASVQRQLREMYKKLIIIGHVHEKSARYICVPVLLLPD